MERYVFKLDDWTDEKVIQLGRAFASDLDGGKTALGPVPSSLTAVIRELAVRLERIGRRH